MDTLKPRPCPVAQLVAHSEEHFIDRRSEGPADETFEQLAARRAGNVGLLMRFIERMESGGALGDQRVRTAFYLLGDARAQLEAAAAGR